MPYLQQKLPHFEISFPFSNKVAPVCNKDWPLYNESVPGFYGKKPIKTLKASKTRWLTQGIISKRILDFFHKLMETIYQICLNTAESLDQRLQSSLDKS